MPNIENNAMARGNWTFVQTVRAYDAKQFIASAARLLQPADEFVVCCGEMLLGDMFCTRHSR
jgi:hypothetical protein